MKAVQLDDGLIRGRLTSAAVVGLPAASAAFKAPLTPHLWEAASALVSMHTVSTATGETALGFSL